MKKANLSTVNTDYGTVVLNESTGEYWHLNNSAAYIFQELASGSSIDTIAQSLVCQFSISVNDAEKDVIDTKQQLKSLGAL